MTAATVARWLVDLVWGQPKPQANPEQMASMTLYSTRERKVKAVPTRRPVQRKQAS